ncbi:MAG: tetratricopeptide repeat protein [Phycisphaerales bacterium]|nr:MAG: tetratricopeptide repeat protein [Phycisphaerales bacterium]
MYTRSGRSSSVSLFAYALCLCGLLPLCRTASGADIDVPREQFKTGQYTECLESTRKAIEDGAYAADWRILMIKSLMALGQYDQAVREMDAALGDYRWSIRLLKLGHNVYKRNGQGDRAAEMLTRIFRIGTGRDVRFVNADDLVALGESLLLLGGEPKLVLEEFFNRAVRSDPNCLDAYLAAGNLALAKQDYELAANKYREALKRFPTDADAHYGLARAFLNSDRGAMIQSLEAALHFNPRHAPALILLAEHQIDCEEYDAAAKLLDRVIAVNPWNEEAWAYRAVLAYLENDPKTGHVNRAGALTYWPKNPQVDYLIGRKLSQKYRFAEGAAYQRRALKFDPQYLPAKIQLAQDLLRLGQEEEGWALADEVHNQDAYNIEAYNLANLRDNMAKFKTLENNGFIVRMDAHEADVYGNAVLELLQQAKSELCKKYGIELKQPITVELFPEQQDFAVRTFGLPGGEGFLGVCFGNVITANSPKAGKPHNWKAMLWHEFCHVVTLNLTENKMPRWLSEGISVYEEFQRDPTWGQQMNPQYRKKILDSELTPIGNLSAAFMSPPGSMDLQFAYYNSALAVEYIIKRYGYKALRAILAELAAGEEINRAITKHTSSLANIEKEFEAFARNRAEKLAPDVDWDQPEAGQIDPTDSEALDAWLADHPNNFWALTLKAHKLMADRRWQEAKEPLQKLIRLFPRYAGEDNAYRLLAEVHRKLGDTEKERLVLNDLSALSSDAVYAYERLMEIGVEQKDWRQVVTNADKYMAVYPMLGTVHWRLGRANEELGLDERAIEAYRRLLFLEPIDPAEVNYRLARLLQDRDPARAKRHVLEALAEAPRFREAHRLLSKMTKQATQENAP